MNQNNNFNWSNRELSIMIDIRSKLNNTNSTPLHFEGGVF